MTRGKDTEIALSITGTEVTGVDTGLVEEIKRGFSRATLDNSRSLSIGDFIKRFGLTDLDEPTAQTEIDLQIEWERQAGLYVRLGFHTELSLSEEEYFASLPQFSPQPEAFKGRFNIPLLVETRIPIKRQCTLARLGYSVDYFTEHEVNDWENDPMNYKTPDIPYTTWTHSIKVLRGPTVIDVRQNLKDDERGATIFDGVARYLRYPRTSHWMDFPGSAYHWMDRVLGKQREDVLNISVHGSDDGDEAYVSTTNIDYQHEIFISDRGWTWESALICGRTQA